MAKMFEALNILYTGKDAINRQICLFSICGIIGLLNGYLALGEQNLNEVLLWQKILFGILILIFGLFLIGYETVFMHTRELPDINFDIFKIGIKKIPFIIFLIGIPFVLVSLFTKYQYTAFCIETLIAIPLTMIQAGFSYNYQENEISQLFKKYTVKDYFVLLVERLWIVIASYVITFFILFVIFFIGGTIIAIMFKGDVSTISFTVSSQQTVIAKLSNYVTAILLTYILAIGVLVWDYEVVKINDNKP